MSLVATSRKVFKISKSESPKKESAYVGIVSAEALNVRSWAGKNNSVVSFSPIDCGTKVKICDAILSPDQKTWYYIKVGDKYGFVNADYIDVIPDLALKILSCLKTYHNYIKSHSSKFYNEYESDMTSFAKAKKRVSAGKKVGLTCVVPLRWALYEHGIKNGSGKSLISAPKGSFKDYYTGDIKKKLTRITSGGAIGQTIIDAIDKGLLRDGDIVCYKGITHTSTFSGDGYKFYEGGGQCVKDGHYPNGILMDYSKNYYKNKKIAEILRWKG